MKILLFTHEQDIDGMGSIILAKQAFKNLDYITCQTFEINQKVEATIKDNSIYHYDLIFVTDLCIQEPLLSQINKDPQLKKKLIILDHHKSEIKAGHNKYPFVHIIVENEKGKTCGTSLFYDYLITHNFLKPNQVLDEFVELTRQHDTWEWHTIYNNEKARMLYILFESLGYQEYINRMMNIVTSHSTIELTKEDKKIIKEFDQQFQKDSQDILKKMVIVVQKIEENNYTIGYVRTPYKYRNDLNEIVIKNNINNIDVLGMIITDKETVSYRNIKAIDTSIIGTYFGGKGHKTTATHPKNNPKFAKILKRIK